jgi:glycosyltransferase involved in cell wall biosynthesis
MFETTAVPGLVSVIVPVLNAERFLAEALDSVRTQTYPRVELIIVAGPSSDRTDQIALGYRPERFLPQVQPGIWAAFNEGLVASRGEFVAFLGADDHWPPGKLAWQVLRLQARPDLGCVFGHTQLFIQPGAAPPRTLPAARFDIPQPARLLECMLARRTVFEALGPFTAHHGFAGDTEWLARATDAGVPMLMDPNLGVYKRIHAHNAVHADPRANNRALLRILRASVARKHRRTADPAEGLNQYAV